MLEFHGNLRDKIGSIIFVQGVWVPFDSLIINRFFKLQDEDNKEYQALYRDRNYDLILKKLIEEKLTRKKSVSNEVQSVLRTGLTETSSVC